MIVAVENICKPGQESLPLQLLLQLYHKAVLTPARIGTIPGTTMVHAHYNARVRALLSIVRACRVVAPWARCGCAHTCSVCTFRTFCFDLAMARNHLLMCDCV